MDAPDVHEPGPRAHGARDLLAAGARHGDNHYARPLYGLVGAVDINAMELLRLDDHAPGHAAAAARAATTATAAAGPTAATCKPLEITQPEGPGFALDGHGVRWQNWDLRIGFHPREGLVLHDIAYHDAGERRQICHRASIAELVIPYGDPNPTTHFKNVFDIGEYGLGPLTNSLSLGLRLRRRDPLPRRASRTPGPATASRSRTRSASTRRTTACSGSTPTSSGASTGPARGGW